MLFNSYTFIFAFLPVMFFGYFYLLRKRLILSSKIWLIVGSFFFYGYWNIDYIPLLLGSIFVNFFIGSALANHTPSKASRNSLLIIGIGFNISLLAYFKYTDFLLENYNVLVGIDAPLPNIILPLGISFFTFTQIAFLVDAYKEKVKEYDLINYVLFITYFPHLLAGPILHHSEMIPQFVSRWNWAVRWRNVALGLFLFFIGLFKKVMIADTFATWANAGFDVATTLNLVEAWITSLSYTLQLYFDFSGYTDMAIGVSLMFNIRLPANFNSPYQAKDIQDFWRRWHITLSRFLKDYIYIPLGGNKISRFNSYVNLFAVFLIGGLWHGASWMFVIWGALHGTAIVLHRIWKDSGLRMWGWMGWFITFNFVNIAWIFFRAKDFASVEKVHGGMIGIGGIYLPGFLYNKLSFLDNYGVNFGQFLNQIGGSFFTPLWLLVVLSITFLTFNSTRLQALMKPTITYLVITLVLSLCSIFSLNKVVNFLYFNF
jgi:alginate O-acetyltransferase complex protein AlgI